MRNILTILLCLSSTVAVAGPNNWTTLGHYVSFAHEREFQAEMVDVLENPSGKSQFQIDTANELKDVMTTNGVKGLWMRVNWRNLETADGVFDWNVMDQNMDIAEDHNLKLIIQVGNRNFGGVGNDVLPTYFSTDNPDAIVWCHDGEGEPTNNVVAKRWDPWVYNRIIRIQKAIANRYEDHNGFGGIASDETAVCPVYPAANYTLEAYKTALTAIVTQVHNSMTRGMYFFYMNFIKGGGHPDMDQDERPNVLSAVPRNWLVVGGPDITPDVQGMVGNVNNWRLHIPHEFPYMEQFCHFQHVDHGHPGPRGVSTVSNAHRWDFHTWVNNNPSADAHLDKVVPNQGVGLRDLHDPNGNDFGDTWPLWKSFDYANRNFDCSFAFWHYRAWWWSTGFNWPNNTKNVIQNNPTQSGW